MAFMFMSFHSSASIEGHMAVYAALAVQVSNSVFVERFFTRNISNCVKIFLKVKLLPVSYMPPLPEEIYNCKVPTFRLCLKTVHSYIYSFCRLLYSYICKNPFFI
ncbi:hypothetical protein L6164_036667 [Bauhinia variegata]|uniref:Uncharacterized protein n=1 Tax=Bauhinia variegata TaxID=167791 RepID=A0ACB9KHY4_BAUVA|nr:hypothetical protein L6164_036667 [Bauhinia variegata]